MKTAIFLLAIGCFFTGLIAQETIPDQQYGPWVSGGAVVLLGALIWRIITREWPRERDKALEHTESVVRAITEKIGAELQEAVKTQHEDQLALNATLQQLIEKQTMSTTRES